MKNPEQVIDKVTEFLRNQGIRIYKIDVAELDEESIIRVYTNVGSTEKGLKLSEKIWEEIIPNDGRYFVLVYPK